MDGLVLQLKQLGLLKRAPPKASQKSLVAVCEAGALKGGLSLALDVRPDEAIGPLCAALGGLAKTLRVVDVRKEPFELWVRWGDQEERWDVPDVPALVHNLNDLCREDAKACAIVDLGEWQDALQLWCVPKELLGPLFRQRFFQPRNEGDLQLIGK